MINKNEMKILIELVKIMKKEVDEFAEYRISTKYKYLQNQLSELQIFLVDRLSEVVNDD
jgi:hypothetical protein